MKAQEAVTCKSVEGTELITVYEPDRLLRVNFLAQGREMFADLRKSRELIWRLFLRDLRSKYRQSLFGLAWVVISPLATVGVFAYLNSAGVIRIGSTGVPYVAFAIVGLAMWNLFANGINQGAGSIVSAGNMVTKINFSKTALVLSAVGQSAVDFLVRLVLAAVVFLIFKVAPSSMVLFLPLAIIPLMLLTMGLALNLALLGALFRDVTNAVSTASSFLMFLVPVLYPAPKTGIGATLTAWNPLAQLVMGPRDLVLFGALSNPYGFLYSSLFAAVSFFLSWRLFYLSETKITERV